LGHTGKTQQKKRKNNAKELRKSESFHGKWALVGFKELYKANALRKNTTSF